MPDSPQALTARHVLPETTLLVAIGGLDLLYTVFLLARGQAHEANPLFAGLLQTFGIIGFITFKALMLAVPLTVAELARRHNPHFVRLALRVGIGLYLLLYVISFLRYNVHW
jgi:hypothetical protein